MIETLQTRLPDWAFQQKGQCVYCFPLGGTSADAFHALNGIAYISGVTGVFYVVTKMR